ncbi:Cof-type HAD-IIB family hydrolase [Saccharibacillus sp. CPCC 101409]|uniref:Cof-type HAD-IIB family hydrolase n=1 Tax=Saccharibacillus sp. CPCC 101409 TaxID=3058041 RepID=UPI002673EE20|nr:Cof-type HAD-IIB family hydrolase [Saccharibacillus sp. CPCC 101409]MDO3408241.1 Cof-type HAD-IIB family hydrolase [Saccharibacillus sp. CPCC 101409]
MEQSIIFFDIDGTLVDERKKVPESAREAVFELKRRGHIVAIATGRPQFMFREIREELGIDTYVSYSGQYVVLNGEVIYTNPIDTRSLEQMTDIALKHNHPVILIDDEEMKATVPDDEFVAQGFGMMLNYISLSTPDPHFYKERFVYQASLFCSEADEALYEAIFPALDFIRWTPLSADVLPAGGSKMAGIRKITEKLGIPPERQYAFGDALNDMEMLAGVPNSVAMGNGLPEVKEIARWVTRTNEDDGIAYGLKLAGLL